MIISSVAFEFLNNQNGFEKVMNEKLYQQIIQNNKLMKKISNLATAAEELYQMQLEATKNGTFAVSGLLLNEEGDVIHAGSNRVIALNDENGKKVLIDPTGHAEQLMIYWYWQNKEKLNLPEPRKLTILTTLDPCIMCASSIILSGFNVGTISQDDFAGTNYNQNRFKDYDFAPDFQRKLIDSFGYYKVSNVESRKAYQYEDSQVYFRQGWIPKELEHNICQEFLNSVEKLKVEVFKSVLSPTKLSNIKNLSEDDSLVLQLKQVFPDALSITLTQRVKVNGVETNFYEPNQSLKKHLEEIIKGSPSAKNVVALIDTFGNLLLTRSDKFQINPVQTSIVNATVDYSKFYFNEIVKASKENKQQGESKILNYLPALVHCTYVFLNALPGNEGVSLQTVGVYAFANSQPVSTGGLLYINGYQSQKTVTLEDAIFHLAPLYKSQFYNVSPIQAAIGKKEKSQL